MTEDEVRQSLPLRLRKYPLCAPIGSHDDAVRLAAYYHALFQEQNEVLMMAMKAALRPPYIISGPMTEELKTEWEKQQKPL